MAITIPVQATSRRRGSARLGLAASGRLHEPASPDLDLSIVVPFFNTGRDLLRSNLSRLAGQLDESGVRFEVIAVDDGGSDDSWRAVEDLAHPRVRLVRLTANQGKGGALLAGFTQAHAPWVGFIDADGDIDPIHLKEYLDSARASDSDIIAADKTHPESLNDVSGSRRMTSRLMHLVNAKLLGLTLTDTQTGAKIFRRELLAEAVPRARERGFALDVELFVIARGLGFKRVLGMPVVIKRSGDSTVSGKTVVKTGLRVLVIAGREAIGEYHLRQRVWPAAPAAARPLPQPTPEMGRRSGHDRRSAAVPGAGRDRRSQRSRRTAPRQLTG